MRAGPAAGLPRPVLGPNNTCTGDGPAGVAGAAPPGVTRSSEVLKPNPMGTAAVRRIGEANNEDGVEGHPWPERLALNNNRWRRGLPRRIPLFAASVRLVAAVVSLLRSTNLTAFTLRSA